jgi:hypothetical protein
MQALVREEKDNEAAKNLPSISDSTPRSLSAFFKKTAARQTDPLLESFDSTENKVDYLLEQAHKSQPSFSSFIKKLGRKFNAEVCVGDVKSRDRALSKVLNDYEGDASRLADINRATIVVEDQDIEKLVKIAAWFRDKANPENGREGTLWMDDRLSSENANAKDSGYRSLMIKYAFDGKMAVEIQVAPRSIWKAYHDTHPHYVAASAMEKRLNSSHQTDASLITTFCKTTARLKNNNAKAASRAGLDNFSLPTALGAYPM